MAYVPMKTEELKKLVMMGKKRPMNFAYNPGPKEDDLMIIDRIKAPDVLGRLAKKEGTGVKIAAGVFELEGKKLTISVPKELPGLAKKLRKYLKTMDLSFSIVVVDPNGTVLQSDLTDEDQQTTDHQDGTPAQSENQSQDPPAQAALKDQPQQSTQPEPDDAQAEPAPVSADATNQRTDITDRLRALQRPISDLGKVGAPLGKAAGAVIALLKAGSLDKADATLIKIEEGLAKVQASQAAPQAKAENGNDVADGKPALVAKALMARASALRTVIEGLQGSDAELVKPQLFQGLAALKARDWAVADARLSEAENTLNKLPNTATAQKDLPTEGNMADGADQEPVKDVKTAGDVGQDTPSAEAKSQQKWDAMSGKIQVSVDNAMQAKRGDLDGINRAFGYAQSQAEAGEYDSAIAAAANTVKLLKLAAAAPASQGDARAQEAADSVPDNVVAYRKSRVDWVKTRTGLQAELVKLKMAIDTQTSGIAGLEEVAQNTGVLFDYVDELDSALETTLDALLQTPDGSQREKLKGEAIKIIGTYRTTLDSDFFQSVDDNGFTKTTIRSTALAALVGVETALAA